MMHRTTAPARGGRAAFTLIELMVVVAIVAILIGAVFQLMNVIGNMNHKAETTARLQRVQNAISAFYAEYGYYPPVPQYQSPDPWATGKDDYDNDLPSPNGKGNFTYRANLAARSQSVAFEFPNVRGLDKLINQMFDEWRVMSPNTLLGGQAASIPEEEWQEIKMFRFGLLSYLLPRVELVGFTGVSTVNETLEPDINFYKSRQWKKHNPISDVTSTRKALESQQILENRTVARWLPNFEKIIVHGRTILGVNLQEPYTDQEGFRYTEKWQGGKVVDITAYEHNGQKYVLQYVSVRDGWGRELYYYSPPPYQSYRLWSAGPDGNTFPPWIKLENLSAQERAWAAEAIADDLVKFDQ